MRARVRTINKIGRNSYISTSSSVGEHLFATMIYYIVIYPYYLIFKWCIVKPIQFIIEKIKKIRKERENGK